MARPPLRKPSFTPPGEEPMQCDSPPIETGTNLRTNLSSAAKAKELARVERRLKAVRMLSMGSSYEQIAKALGYADRSNARKDIILAHREIQLEYREDAKEARTQDLETLRGIVQRLHMRALDNSLSAEVRISAEKALLVALRRRAEIFGYDAPKQLQVSGHEGAPLSIAMLVAQGFGQGEVLTVEQSLAKAATNGTNGASHDVAKLPPAGDPVH